MTWKRKILYGTIFGLAILACIVGFVLNFSRVHATSPSHKCQNNLRLIDAAKNQWAMENKKSTNETPSWNDIRPYIPQIYLESTKQLKCPEGGTYVIGKIGQVPTCSLGGYHSIE